MVEIRVVNGDILTTACDLLILKHADGFYGADKSVADLTGFQADVPEGDHAFSRGIGTEARKVLYVGVGPLVNFRYEKIRQFAENALAIAAKGSGASKTICTTVHGPGYGLDDHEALLSLVSGFRDAIARKDIPRDLSAIIVVEKSAPRARRFSLALKNFQASSNSHQPADRLGGTRLQQPDTFGAKSETKRKLFVAMPFADAYSDVWDIAIKDACEKVGITCETIAEAAFTGDIVSEIRKRLESCSGLIAVLDDANPNVFLELGYAWALGKPTVLLSKAADKLPFDVKGQRCLIYKSINNLRELLTTELGSLMHDGKFGNDPR